MNVKWEPVARGTIGTFGRFTVTIRRTKDEWSWSVEAPDRDLDVRGRASTGEAARDYALACLHVAVERDAARSVRVKDAQIARLTACITGVFPSVALLPAWENWRTEAAAAINDTKGGTR